MGLLQQPAARASKVDGRRLRSIKTRRRIIDAYLSLAHEKSPLIPTAVEIARQANCSVRSIFERFSDIHGLQVAAVDQVLSEITPPPPPREGDDRLTRIRAQVETRSRSCERWLPLWRSLMANQGESVELRQRAVALRERIVARLASMYEVELSTVSPADRKRLLIVLEALTDTESWARMKEFFGLSFEDACQTWTQAIDRLLPPTPSRA